MDEATPTSYMQAAHASGTVARIPGYFLLSCRHLQHDLYAITREAVLNARKQTNGIVAVHALTRAQGFVMSIVNEEGGRIHQWHA
jgi:hypothetical protein